ncbi:hypothetical protein ACOSQ4_019107 [Xanthoceras sorbifolium]
MEMDGVFKLVAQQEPIQPMEVVEGPVSGSSNFKRARAEGDVHLEVPRNPWGESFKSKLLHSNTQVFGLDLELERRN